MGGFPRSIKIQALNDVNFSVASQEPVIISVVGESGSGKTTLAKVILRLVQQTSGQVIVSNQLVAGVGAKPDKTGFLRTVQPIFQNPFSAINRSRTIDTVYLKLALVRAVIKIFVFRFEKPAKKMINGFFKLERGGPE